MAQQKSEVTIAILNGVVWTGEPRQPWAEAIALSGDRIAAVGSTTEIRSLVSERTRVIDARGGMVTPGFIDSHVHFLSGGMNLASVQLRDARTPAEFISRIKAFARAVQPGTWITGGDWDHQNWGGELPQSSWIDSVTPNNPVWINRLDGHMALANTAAMRSAKVPSTLGDIAGGTIVRDASLHPSGIFKDNAQDLIDAAVHRSDAGNARPCAGCRDDIRGGAWGHFCGSHGHVVRPRCIRASPEVRQTQNPHLRGGASLYMGETARYGGRPRTR